MALFADTQPHFTIIGGVISQLEGEIVALFRNVLLTCDAQGLIGRIPLECAGAEEGRIMYDDQHSALHPLRYVSSGDLPMYLYRTSLYLTRGADAPLAGELNRWAPEKT